MIYRECFENSKKFVEELVFSNRKKNLNDLFYFYYRLANAIISESLWSVDRCKHGDYKRKFIFRVSPTI